MSHFNMFYFNWVDFVIMLVVLLSTLISFFRGFLREAISLIVWVAAVVIAFKFVNLFQIYLQPWISSDSARYIVTFVGLFFLVFLLGIILNAIIHALLSKSGLSITNRLLGIFFGAVRGILIVVAVLIFINAKNIKNNDLLASRLVPEFTPLVVYFEQLLPEKLKHFSQWFSDYPSKDA